MSEQESSANEHADYATLIRLAGLDLAAIESVGGERFLGNVGRCLLDSLHDWVREQRKDIYRCPRCLGLKEMDADLTWYCPRCDRKPTEAEA